MKKLLSLIPNHVRITKNVTYEVVWCDEFFKDGDQMGECWYEGKQIKINKNQSATEAFKTFIHEVFHAASFENKSLKLTETQVRALEDAMFRILKLNGLL